MNANASSPSTPAAATRRQVLAYRPLPEDLRHRIEAVHALQCVDPFADPQAFERALGQADALIGTAWKLDRALLARAPRLRVISSTSAGLDHVDQDAVRERGIVLCSTRGAVEECVADTAFALILCIQRRLPDMIALVRSGQWHQRIGTEHFGHDVFGKTLGLLGFGGIGQAIARRAACGFGMRVLYHRRTAVPVAFGDAQTAARVQWAALPELLAGADIVVSTLPLTEATRGFMGRTAFGAMRRGAVFINVGRGGTVDEQALLDALDAGQVSAAGLDVFAEEPLPPASPWIRHPRVVPLPHIGAATHETRHAMLALATDNLLAALAR